MIELSFKLSKQHRRIKRFFGASGHVVKSQIWIAVTVYMLIAVVKKRVGRDASLCTLLPILSLALFEKIPMGQALTGSDHRPENNEMRRPFEFIRNLRDTRY